MKRLEWAIAWRYMRSRRQSALLSFITMIAMGGVIVGVSALIVIIGVMNGLQIDLREKILLGSPDIHVLAYGGNLRMAEWRSVLDSVRGQPDVVAAAPFVTTQALVTNRAGYSVAAHIRGIPPQTPETPAITDLRDHVREGDFTFASGDGARRGVVLGRRLAENLNVYVGDTLLVMTRGGMSVADIVMGRVPLPIAVPVTGVFESGMFQYDDGYLFADLDAARRMAGLGDAVSGIEVRTRDRWVAERVAARIDSTLRFQYQVVAWREQNASLFSALKLEKFAMSVILLLVVIVAAFNIVSTLTMVVRDKTREIGILKAMGMRARSVRNVFVLQGFVIGVVGTGVGLLLGVIAGVAIGRYELIPLDPQIYFIDHLPVALQVVDTTLIVLASVAIATVATLYPARQAARLYPVEAIRHE